MGIYRRENSALVTEYKLLEKRTKAIETESYSTEKYHIILKRTHNFEKGMEQREDNLPDKIELQVLSEEEFDALKIGQKVLIKLGFEELK